MARTFIRQATQIRKSDAYTDNVAPSLANYETNPVSVEDDLNSLRSQVHNLLKIQAGNWYDDLNAPSALDAGAKRGVNDLNTDLHALERKRVLVSADKYLVDVTVPSSQQYVVLGPTQLPSNTTAAVGAVTTAGTVVAYLASFGTASLVEVGGSSAISPKNLCDIVDSVTHDPILSGGRRIYALLQSESSTDGHTITDTTPTRVQLSFVRLNSAGNDLELVPTADIEGKVLHYAAAERKALEDLTEQDFLRGAVTDVPASAIVTRQVAYDDQGSTPVNVTTNSTLDIEGPGLYWEIRDDAEATIFKITEGSAGGTTQVLVTADTDTFEVNALINDFDNGVKVATGTTEIDIGVTAGTVETTGANDLKFKAAQHLYLTDSHRAGSTWSVADGIKLSNASSEWDDFETAFGEVSLLRGVYLAYSQANRNAKVYANVTADVAANADVGGVSGGSNLDAQLPDMSSGTFTSSYDVYLNGNLLQPGANASANNDYYPGTSLANGQLKFEFGLKTDDVICVVPYI